MKKFWHKKVGLACNAYVVAMHTKGGKEKG
jgi:hypothetical protein